MKKQALKPNIPTGLVWDRLVLVLFLFCIINQGSYFNSGILLATGALLLCCIVKRLVFDVTHLPALLFCGWYIFSAFKGGFVLEYAITALLPLSAFLFYLVVTQTVADKQRFWTEFVKASAVVAVIALGVTLFHSLGTLQLQRATFPFGSANGAGIFYGVLLLMTAKKKGALKYLFGAALVLTQSVGAILVTLFLLFLTDFKNKRNLVLFAVLIVLGVCLRDRVSESVYTFAERLLQAYDGGVCMAKHPLFGIGVGRWAILRPYYQSGVYTAKIIHSIPVQIGVSSGVPGLLLFGLAILQPMVDRFKKDRTRFWLAAALLLHSFLDVTFAYGGLAMLFAALLAKEEQPAKHRWVDSAVFVLLLSFTAVLAVGTAQVQTLKHQVLAFSYPEAAAYYENRVLPRYANAGQMEYLKALYAQKRFDEALATMDKIEPKSDDIYLLTAWCGEESALLDGLKVQPYNEKLYDELSALDKEAAEQLWNEGVERMSGLGKILYYREGAKQK